MLDKLDCILSLATLQNKMQKAADRALGLHGISFSEFYILYYLERESTKTMRRIDLAESMAMSASGITRALTPMEKIGLIRKETNPRDARVSLVKLTPSGERVFEETLLTMKTAADDLLGKLSDEDVVSLIAIMQKIL